VLEKKEYQANIPTEYIYLPRSERFEAIKNYVFTNAYFDLV
jgi:hypothetical protein